MTWEHQKDSRTGYTRDEWKQPPLYAIVEQVGIYSYVWRVSRNLETPNARGDNWEVDATGESNDRNTAKHESKAALMSARTAADKTFAARWFGD